MPDNTNKPHTACFWQNRYQTGNTEWDIGFVSPPIKHYIDSQLQTADRTMSILIAGAGNAYEAIYLHQLGFNNVTVLDFAQAPLDNVLREVPTFNRNHLLKIDFFELDEKQKQYDLSIEQTFFCAINPNRRKEFVTKTHALLKPGGRLIGVLWDCEFEGEKPPYGGDPRQYQQLFAHHFELSILAKCSNSHPKRQGRELFIEFIAK